MVTRKTLKKKVEKIDEPPSKARKVDPRIKVATLPDAVREGKFVGAVGQELIVMRPHDGRQQKMLCTVRSLGDDKVETWDETLERQFTFEPSRLEKYKDIVIKLYSAEPSSES